jgi:hypothetical protein
MFGRNRRKAEETQESDSALQDERDEAINKVKSNLADLSKALNLVAASIREMNSVHVRKITYENCIEYFVENKPPKFLRAAILRETIGMFRKEYKITQIYLDKNDDLVRDLRGRVYGRVVLADKIDEELEYAFGKYDILIVE